MIYDRKLAVYCDSEDIFDDMLMLMSFNCPDTECTAVVNSWTELKEHIRKTHKRILCEICVKHKKVFAHEHSLYTLQTLSAHKKKGDGDPSCKGHPSCGFCSSFFYGSDELFEHCREKHEECHVC
jgi:E3 ubiquitin-protein ligase ZNF598